MARKRFYLAWSLAFDTEAYDVEAIKAAVKDGGGLNVRTARQFGWSNQPRVVTWSIATLEYDELETARPNKAIRAELYRLKPFGKFGGLPAPIIYEKNWR